MSAVEFRDPLQDKFGRSEWRITLWSCGRAGEQQEEDKVEINFKVKPQLPLNEIALSQIAHWVGVLEGTQNEDYDEALTTSQSAEQTAEQNNVGAAPAAEPKKRGRKASAPLTAAAAPEAAPVAFPAFAGTQPQPQPQPAPEPATAVGFPPRPAPAAALSWPAATPALVQQAPVQQFAQPAPQPAPVQQFAQPAPQPAPVQQFAQPAPVQQFAPQQAPVQQAPVQQQFAPQPAPVQQQPPAMPQVVQQVPQDGNGDMSLEEFREWCRQAHMRAPGMPYNLMKVSTWINGESRSWGVMGADGVPAADRRRFVNDLGLALSQQPAA